MSDSNLKIALNAETTFGFELAVKGIEVGSADVRFGLEKNGTHLQFKCTKKADGTWSVSVPSLSSFNLKEGLYKYTIEVIADGYYFAPVKGTAEVAPAASVKGNLVKKDVKVAVSGIKVTENKIVKSRKTDDDKIDKIVKKVNEEKKVKFPVVKKIPKRMAETENKFNKSNKESKSRLQELAGIK
jgi:hypothetical protein